MKLELTTTKTYPRFKPGLKEREEDEMHNSYGDSLEIGRTELRDEQGRLKAINISIEVAVGLGKAEYLTYHFEGEEQIRQLVEQLEGSLRKRMTSLNWRSLLIQRLREILRVGRKDRVRTADRIAAAIRKDNFWKSQSIEDLALKAETGYYDEFVGVLDFPLNQLEMELRTAKMHALADRVREGEFNASKDEAMAWLSKNWYKLLR